MGTENFSSPQMGEHLVEFNRIYKQFGDIYRDAAKKMKISNSVFDILYTICEVGSGCLQKDICNATFIPKQTVNSAIRNLEQSGYLTLTPGKGRNMHIYLTPEGQKLIHAKMFPIIAAEDKAFSALSEDECRTLLKLQHKYVNALQKEIDCITGDNYF